jgi:hypothetical protein
MINLLSRAILRTSSSLGQTTSSWPGFLHKTLETIPKARNPYSIVAHFRRGSQLVNNQRVSFYSTKSVQEEKPVLKGWRRHAHRFREAPASYITSLAILHELTAILPFPIIYYALDVTGFKLPLPEKAREEGEAFALRLIKRYGWGSSTPETDTNNEQTTASDTMLLRGAEGGLVDATSQVFINLAITYAIVKALMPVRIALSVAMTPWFARTVVDPALAMIRRTGNWIRNRGSPKI